MDKEYQDYKNEDTKRAITIVIVVVVVITMKIPEESRKIEEMLKVGMIIVIKTMEVNNEIFVPTIIPSYQL